MLSIIVYGRNDSHGYNYHKRLAISLNCLAALLSGATDEIVFVDYNTPSDLPTAIEAIQDTLTPKAKSVIRVLRVRPLQAHGSSLATLEPVARNVGIRRSNPANKWILSTNSDMVFVPVDPARTLTSLVSTLEDGFYLLPRFEVPENVWEQTFQRLDPEGTMTFLREHGQALQLNTVIRKAAFLRYDNPGDFQLMLRDDIFAIRGFDETMVKGWHVDSNVCRRMSLLGRSGASLERLIKGYHCNHTHKHTLFHDQNRSQNSWYRYVESPHITAVLPQENWGLQDEEVEEIALSSSHLSALQAIMNTASAQLADYLIHPTTYNRIDYNPSRIFTYFADHLCHLPPRATVVYVGGNAEIVRLIREYLKRLKGTVLCPHASEPIPAADLVIFDFGIEEKTFAEIGYLACRRAVKPIMQRFCKCAPSLPIHTKCIGINVNYTDFGAVFSRYLSVRSNSHITGISYGYTHRLRQQPLGLSMQYFVCRYLYSYSDRIRKIALRMEETVRGWMVRFHILSRKH